MTIGIIAALAIEGAAMRTLIARLQPVHVSRDSHVYRVGYLDSANPGRPHRAVLATLPDDNTRNAAATCADMIRSFDHLRCVIMVGIAGGVPAPRRPQQHVRLGDLIIASGGIFDYGHIRQGPNSAEQRRPVGGMSPDLRTAAQQIEEDQLVGTTLDWARLLTPPDEVPVAVFSRPAETTDRLHRGQRVIPHPDRDVSGHPEGFPKVHFGTVASGDVLMRSAQQRDQLVDRLDVLAFEMETAGVAAAAAARGIGWFVVRGIADYSDEHKNDVWHSYGSFVAAGGVRGLLERCQPFLVPSRQKPGGAQALLPDQEMDRLGDYLTQAQDVDGEAAWSAAVGDLLSPPDGRISLSGMAEQLSGQNAGPDRIPPLLAFVEQVAGRCGSRLAGQLRAWSDRVARQALDLDDRILTYRQSVELSLRRDTLDRPPIRPCLLIQIERDGIESDSCEVRYWIQRRASSWSPEPSDPQQTTFRELERVLETMIREAATTWRDLDGPAEIEFILPLSLLNRAVEWWHTELDAAAPIPLCLDYRVVVRSLERMQQAHRRPFWNHRWRSLWAPPAGHRVHWGRSAQDDHHLGPWAHRLRADQEITSVVLGGSPEGGSGRDELLTALDAGIPVILWDHRPGATAPEMLDLLHGITDGTPQELVDRIHDLRKNAGLLEPGDQERHLGRHLALLWDDPDRNVYDMGAQP
ncbi:hypothetical protein KOI35_32585 [Actinoplanes bogorensis]|uniref:Nucleoside phosphorylase domain-containing protein n=1 Tax=Paractinoplanes bogorensis TaxID=1610840 RepID=A0ABS5YXU5_9ACTN|nr:hypothetical protein [Actinoplanes bogorensis]MBU2668260.1 hypothetical protein [Actinoplanes bogorensis]